MTIQLVDFSKTFELEYSGAKFTLCHWTNAMQDKVDRACVVDKGNNIFAYDIAKERELKIDLSVQGWSGITEINPDTNAEQEVTCTSDNKRKLPVGVTLWLQKQIEERAGLRITPDEKKN